MGLYSPKTGRTTDPTCHHSDKNTPGACGRTKVEANGLLLCPVCDLRALSTVTGNKQ